LPWSVLTGALVAAGLCCSAETRYDVLTIFFEGVPPPGFVPIPPEPGGRSGRLTDPVSFHTAFRKNNCTECHVGKGRVLRTPIPELCRRCHDKPVGKLWLHAPARSGECAACHGGHESAFPALLLAAGPALCYRCHRDSFVQGLPAHEKVDLAACMNCHPAHEGGTVGVPRREEEIPAPMAPEEAPSTATIPVRPVPRIEGTTEPSAVPPIFGRGT
jgi:predicted CXXCH cytochrome family protein